MFPQLTSSSGALCVINPLYLHEHGDEWLPRRAAPPANYSRGRRLSTPRPWAGAGLQSKRTSSLDQEASGAGSESSGEELLFIYTLRPPTSRDGHIKRVLVVYVSRSDQSHVC